MGLSLGLTIFLRLVLKFLRRALKIETFVEQKIEAHLGSGLKELTHHYNNEIVIRELRNNIYLCKLHYHLYHHDPNQNNQFDNSHIYLQ